ncbi:MAG TPA: hypothetical protein VGS15_07310 [Candidatus Acidoferrales bacterium]|nr:hypothetical protein [Candidatus Acidoferrales bacterium]
MKSVRSLAGLAGIGAILMLLTPACNSLAGSPGGNLTISVAADGNITTLLAGLNEGIQATVTHAGGNPAVTWTITNCSTNCGSLSNSALDHVIYTAPQNVTASSSVSITATAVVNTSRSASVSLTIEPLNCSAGNETALKGQYAFEMAGANPNFLGMAITQVGSFTADGTGKITTGEEDGAAPPASTFTIQASGSSYTLGADDRGCLTLLTSDGTTTKYRFAVGGISSGVATAGRMIEFDDANGMNTRMEGVILKQDATAFTTNTFQGNWAFGMAGAGSTGERVASAGTFTATSGLVTSGEFDTNDAGTVTNLSITGGVLGAADANGRVSTGMGTSSNGTFLLPETVYIVSSKQMLALAHPGTFPFGSGEALRQNVGTFANNSLNANGVMRISGFTSGKGADVNLGIFTGNGGGSFTGTLDTNDAGTLTGQQALSGTYVATADGRTTTMGFGSSSPILYLSDNNAGFILGTGSSVDFGIMEAQATGPFSNSSLSGIFFFGTQSAGLLKRPLTSGMITADGAGSYTGTIDESTGTGLVPGNPLSNSYAFSTTSTVTGRGTVDSASDTVAYIISSTRLVFISSSSTTPSITIVEK